MNLAERVLVVDDAPHQLLLLKLMLGNEGYEVITAENGHEAWELLQSQAIHLVVSDWAMPEMDGIELCRRLRATALPRYVYFILLTGHDDTGSLVSALEAGANDFLAKPVNMDELRARLRAGLRIIRLQHELEERNQRLGTALNELRRDLDSAAAMQRRLLPAPWVRPPLHCQWFLKPGNYLAGDMLDYFTLPDGRFVFYQLDVSGHGVPAALLSFSLHSELRSLHFAVDQVGDPAEIAAQINRRFDGEDGKFFTLFYGQLDPASGELCWVRAGHPPPLLLRADGTLIWLEDGGPPLGILPGLSWTAQRLRLHRQDRLFLYSDGITECADAAGNQFGPARLVLLARDSQSRPLGRLPARLAARLLDWLGAHTEQQDDVSLLALEYCPS